MFGRNQLRADVVQRMKDIKAELDKDATKVRKGDPACSVAATFKVDDVAVENKKLPIKFSWEMWGELLNQPIEAAHIPNKPLVDDTELHGLVAAVHYAFSEHLPLVLSPDHIWICITQGLASHINANAEELRHHFVKHQGKAKITVRRDDFVKGAFLNPWPEVFGEFSDKIKGHIGEETHSFISSDFTTTGDVERAVSHIVLMDAMQKYFSYEFCTMCGIPNVTLEGSAEDWVKLRQKAQKLEQYNLGWWTEQLFPILDKIVQSAQGTPDKDFWKNIYKIGGGSGGPYISGWIIALFPYLKGKRNQYIAKHKMNAGMWGEDVISLETSQFLPTFSTVPFKWFYYSSEFDMKFIGGFTGCTQDPDTFAVRPAVGWAVIEDQQQPEQSGN